MLNAIINQMLRKRFTEASEELKNKWTSLNLYEKKRVYFNWHFEWPSKELRA